MVNTALQTVISFPPSETLYSESLQTKKVFLFWWILLPKMNLEKYRHLGQIYRKLFWNILLYLKECFSVRLLLFFGLLNL